MEDALIQIKLYKKSQISNLFNWFQHYNEVEIFIYNFLTLFIRNNSPEDNVNKKNVEIVAKYA